jgi:NADP-dependent 3-hydroxy acid dehydrogenase YdfG
LITGASSGIGRGRHSPLPVRGQCRAGGGQQHPREDCRAGAEPASLPAVSTDVTDAEALSLLSKSRCALEADRHCRQQRWRIDSSPVAETDPADLQRMLNVSLFGALHVMQAAVGATRASGGAS